MRYEVGRATVCVVMSGRGGREGRWARRGGDVDEKREPISTQARVSPP